MSAKVLSPENIEQLKDIKRQLAELRERAEQRLIEYEKLLANSELY